MWLLFVASKLYFNCADIHYCCEGDGSVVFEFLVVLKSRRKSLTKASLGLLWHLCQNQENLFLQVLGACKSKKKVISPNTFRPSQDTGKNNQGEADND